MKDIKSVYENNVEYVFFEIRQDLDTYQKKEQKQYRRQRLKCIFRCRCLQGRLLSWVAILLFSLPGHTSYSDE